MEELEVTPVEHELKLTRTDMCVVDEHMDLQ